MASLEIFAVLFIGLALGSFSTALIYRVPRGLSWGIASRSRCPSCDSVLKARDLVPVFSWLALKGKCRSCKAPISARYPFAELMVLIACLAVYAAHGVSPEAGFLILLAPFLGAALFIDLEELILPDVLLLTAGVIGAARAAFLSIGQGWETGTGLAAAALVYAALAWGLGFMMSRLLKKDALGFGDVKLFALAGLWLGFSALPGFLLLSGVFGVVFGLIWRKMKGEAAFPFGPALIAALYALLLFQGSLLP